MKMKLFGILIILILLYGKNISVLAGEIPFSKPESADIFSPLYHFPPVDQGETNACWSFSTLSFIESELFRLKGKSVKLAVIYPVYYAFIEKAKYFVKTKGKSRFAAGDLFPTVIEIIQTYGIVPDSVYQGQINFTGRYDHSLLESEIENLKSEIILENSWQEDKILVRLRQILDNHLGRPPDAFEYKGQTYTPLSFAGKFINLDWNDYILITSFAYASFYQFISLDVPDNWRGLNSYYNVPLDIFYSGMISALSGGYSVAIDGDISEPGRIGSQDVCYIPSYDIPSSAIDQMAREYRFERKITTDDHLMHMVGYVKFKGEDWFLVKDSWHDAWQGAHKGYFMYNSDYSRLKVLAYLVHKNAVPEIVSTIKQP